jgi:PAS domain S-box-containing protein
MPGGIPADRILANAHLAAIVDSSDDAIVSKSLKGIIQSWNLGAERLFGYSASEAVGQSIAIIIPKDRLSEEDMILSRIQRGLKVDHFRTIRRRKDGTEVPVSVTVSPITNESGEIIGASKIARDDSDRVSAETADAHLAAIVASSDDAIISKDLFGVVKSWNRGAEQLFGYLAEEMIGQPITILLPEDRLEEETSILERVRRGERVDHFETVRVRKDGKTVHVSVTISPIFDRSGKVAGASKVARDISEKKRFEATTAALTAELEHRVQERTAELEAANKEMEAFTYSIAHDLRAPLRAIIATSAILAEDLGDSLPKEALPLLARQAGSAMHLSRLVDDLLTYARLGKGQMKVGSVNLSELVYTIISAIKSPIHTFTVQENMVCQGDQSLIYLLMQNLIENAHKFSPEGGVITVGQEGLTFFVRDEGIGFDMAYAEKIFLPFERLVRQDEIAGTGIGLANAKKIVERHNGAIWATSVPGQGTTIYFTLHV